MVRGFNRGQHITTVAQERYLMLHSKNKFLVQFLKYFHSVDLINKKTLIEKLKQEKGRWLNTVLDLCRTAADSSIQSLEWGTIHNFS